MIRPPLRSSFFFFNDTATTEIYTLSLHDALPILAKVVPAVRRPRGAREGGPHAPGRQVVHAGCPGLTVEDRKSTRLISSHGYISYAVFCLKKKKKTDPCISAPECTCTLHTVLPLT